MEKEPVGDFTGFEVILEEPLMPTERLPALNPEMAAEGRIGGVGFGVTTMTGGGTNVDGGAGLACATPAISTGEAEAMAPQAIREARRTKLTTAKTCLAILRHFGGSGNKGAPSVAKEATSQTVSPADAEHANRAERC